MIVYRQNKKKEYFEYFVPGIGRRLGGFGGKFLHILHNKKRLK